MKFAFLKYISTILLSLCLALSVFSCSSSGIDPNDIITTTISSNVSLGGYETSEGSCMNIYNATISITALNKTVEYPELISDNSYLSLSGLEHTGSFTIEISFPENPSFGTLSKTIETSEYYYNDSIVFRTADYAEYSRLKIYVSDTYNASSYLENYVFTIQRGGKIFEISSNNNDYIYVFNNGSIDASISADGYAPSTKTFELEGSSSSYSTSLRFKLFEEEIPRTYVNGYVTFTDSDVPVANASIKYSRARDTIYTHTDETGFYLIEVPHKGSFTLEISAEDMYDKDEYFTTTDRMVTRSLSLNVDSNTWSTISGTVYEDDGTTEIEGAVITLGDFTCTTDANGDYKGIYAIKGQPELLTVSANGFYSETVNINSYSNTIIENFTLDANTNPANPDVALSGTVKDSSTGSLITDNSLSVTADVTQASISSGNYSCTSLDNTDGNIIIQAGALGYNIYSWSITTSEATVTHDIELTPLLENPVTTYFSGYIKDQDGNIPDNLDTFSLSFGASLATIDESTGYYTCSSPNNMGAVIVQGGASGYQLLRRTVETSSTDCTYDIVFSEI